MQQHGLFQQTQQTQQTQQMQTQQEQMQQQEDQNASSVAAPLKRQRDDDFLLAAAEQDLFDDPVSIFTGSFGSSSEDDHDFSFGRETTTKVVRVCAV
jgi:hypothetical protein